MATSLDPTHRLLVNCIRRSVDTSTAAVAGLSIAPDLDWVRFTELATSHNIAPIAYSALDVSEAPIPTPIRKALHANYLGAKLRLEYAVEPIVREILTILQCHGVNPIVLKGPALAYTVYEEPCHRSFADIDLLLLDDELDDARGILCQYGFRSQSRQEDSAPTSRPQPDHHLRALDAPDGQLEVELHRHLIPEPHPYTIDLGHFRERAVRSNVAGVNTLVLSAADELFLACIHLSYAHHYLRFPLRNLADIFAISTVSAGRSDWELLLETTRRSRAAGAVYWPLRLAQNWLGAPIPAGILSDLAPPAPGRALLGVFADPAYILDGDVSDDREVLYRMLVKSSLYSRYSVREQVGAILRTVDPANAHGSVPAGVVSARVQSRANLVHPRRVARGLRCVGHLVKRLATG